MQAASFAILSDIHIHPVNPAGRIRKMNLRYIIRIYPKKDVCCR